MICIIDNTLTLEMSYRFSSVLSVGLPAAFFLVANSPTLPSYVAAFFACTVTGAYS